MSATAITTDDLATIDEAVGMLDAMLRVIGAVRIERPHDPLRRLEDVLLERRTLLEAAKSG